MQSHDILLRKLRTHSPLDSADEEILRGISLRPRVLASGEDLIREGDHPRYSAVVIRGCVARYHTLQGGARQYLSIHLPGDWPDAQGLLLRRLDHAVCALGAAEVALIHHDFIHSAVRQRASIGFALWRETLLDAAIFRQAISNIGGRSAHTRLAHLLSELYYRAGQLDLVADRAIDLPLNQQQFAEALGMALVTVNRAVKSMRATGAADLRNQRFHVFDWDRLATYAEFDPAYLTV